MMNVNGIFNPENRFWSFMDKVTDVCFISILWFLFSLPMITMGAATTALFHFTLKLTEDEEGYVWRTFTRAFFGNFVQATVLWVGGLLVGAFLLLDLYYCKLLEVPQPVRIFLFAALISLLLIYLLTFYYVLPLISFFRLPLKKAITNAFVMAVGNLPISVTVLVVYGACAVLTYFMPFLFMVWYGLGCYLSSYLFRFVFRRYMEDGGGEEGKMEG